MSERTFQAEFLKLSLPIALQGVLQASFSVVDQIMVGQMGSVAVAGIGLGGKFASLYSVILAAIAAAAGILIAQYLEDEDPKPAARSFYQNLLLMLALSAVFTLPSIFLSGPIVALYSSDAATVGAGAEYLRVLAWSFPCMALTSICSVLLRCKGAASLPLYAGAGAAVLNTVLNYALIFGRLGFPALGVRGAALATVAAQLFACLLTLGLFWRREHREAWRLPFSLSMDRERWRQYGVILLPILLCEFFWSLGENVYAAVYGHIGTAACAAMTLTVPVQSLTMGALTGVSQSAGILVGRRLGRRDFGGAYDVSRRLMWYGLAACAALSACLVPVRGAYVQIFRVESEVRTLTAQLLLVYAAVAPVKALNMILGGGVLRSGGKTRYVMLVDLAGTWLFGVPLALLSAFCLGLPIPWVYFILSQEELVRLLISLRIFRGKRWMERL